MLKLEGNEAFPRRHVDQVFSEVINNPDFYRSQTHIENHSASYVEDLQDDDAPELIPYMKERSELNRIAKELLFKIKRRNKFSIHELNALKEVQQRLINFDRQATIVSGGGRAVAMMIEEASSGNHNTGGISGTDRSSSVFL